MAKKAWDPRNPRVATADGSNSPKIIHGYLEANSQSFKAGEPVAFSGATVIAGAGGDVPIAGIAMKSATNVTSGNIEIPVQVINPSDEVYIQVSTGGTLQAADTTCTPGLAYDIIIDSGSEFWTLDSADTTNPKFVFQEPIKDVNGTSTYWAKVKLYLTEAQLWNK